MTINRENYPLYFLDYFEGRLSEEGRRELMLFLESHPDLQAEFEAFEVVPLDSNPQLTFPGKDRLKKDPGMAVESNTHSNTGDLPSPDDLFFEEKGTLLVNPGQAEWVLIAFAEGDLGARESEAVISFLESNPHYQRDLELLRVARLKPEPTGAFPRKAAIKRHTIGTFVRRWSYTAAASAAAVLMGFIMWHYAPHFTTTEYTQDTPADPGRERTEAVAEVPGLQQRQPRAMTPRPPQLLYTGEQPGIHLATTTSRLASLQETPALRPGASGERQEDADRPLIPSAMRPSLASRMHMRAPETAGYTTFTHRAAPEMRQEYYWLAYRDRSDLFEEDPARPSAEADRQGVSLARFAREEMEERTGIQLAHAEEVLSTDVSLIGRYARRGLGSINNLLGQPVVVDGETKADGRTVTFAIGNFFEVSKK